MDSKKTYMASKFIAAMLMTTASVTLHAQSITGLYGGVGFGYNDIDKQIMPYVDTPFGKQPGGYLDTDNGYVGIANLGWGFGNGIRVELEANYRNNSAEQASAGALRDAEATGHEKKTGLFVNALYEFHFPSAGISPYVGAGYGQVWSKWDNIHVFNPTESVRLSDMDESSAYQGIVGISFLENWKPGLSFTTEYRYLKLEERVYEGRVEKSRFGAFPTTAHVDSSENHSIVIGLRYQFGAKNSNP